MNKYISMLAFVAGALVIASCSDSEADQEINNDSKVMTFKISSPSAIPTSRAAIGNLNLNDPSAVYWEEGDKISVFGDAEDKSNHLLIRQSSSGNYGSFSGDAFEANNYIFMYPYQPDATFDGECLKATIPTVQKATKGGFDPQAAICGGKALKGASGVSLAHACAFILIETQADCDYIRIDPDLTAEKPSWYFTGGVELRENSSGTAITINNSTGGNQYVMLTADGTENCSSTFPQGCYMIAVASSTGFPKMKITVKYAGKRKIAATSESALQLGAGTIHIVGHFDEELGQRVLDPVPVPTESE